MTLPSTEWEALAAAHAARADDLTAGHRERSAVGEKHPVEDFLYEYYGTKPRHLRRWHPGPGVTLLPGDDGPAPHAGWRWYRTGGDGAVELDTARFAAERQPAVRFVLDLLEATLSRPAQTACFGLHEWAMVYRQDEHRHTLPLRLGQDGTDAVVESHRIRCSHHDAFRFFTPAAVGRNELQPAREDQVAMEQPGCLHAGMDLWKWAHKLSPAVPGDLALDCFELARDVRTLDMQASPYDVTSLGERPVRIETAEGKAEYVRRQREFTVRANALRRRMVAVCRRILDEARAG